MLIKLINKVKNIKCITIKNIKQIIAFCCVFSMLFITGCTTSTLDQEKTVDLFFEYASKCDLDKLKTVATDKVINELGIEKIDNDLKIFTEDAYGKNFFKEINKFKNELYKDAYKEVKISNIKKDNKNKYIVQITGKIKDYSNISQDSNKTNKIITDYLQKHKEELQKLYQEKGENEYLIKVFDNIGPKIIEEMRKSYNKAPNKNINYSLTLQKRNKKWYITNIK